MDDRYKVKIVMSTPKGFRGKIHGNIYEGEEWIGSFDRNAPVDGFISPLKIKFFSPADEAKFEDWADSESKGEALEALCGILPDPPKKEKNIA